MHDPRCHDHRTGVTSHNNETGSPIEFDGRLVAWKHKELETCPCGLLHLLKYCKPNPLTSAICSNPHAPKYGGFRIPFRISNVGYTEQTCRAKRAPDGITCQHILESILRAFRLANKLKISVGIGDT